VLACSVGEDGGGRVAVAVAVAAAPGAAGSGERATPPDSPPSPDQRTYTDKKEN
jgi:hypothetical protein